MKTASLLNDKEKVPFVSLILPTHKKFPMFKTDELMLKNMIAKTEDILDKTFDKKITRKVISSLVKLKSTLDFKKLSEGLVMHSSPIENKIFHLNFSPEQKVIVDTNFALKDMLCSYKSRNCYHIVVVSEHKVRIIKNSDDILEEQYFEELPFGKNDVGSEGHSKTQKYSSTSFARNLSDPKEYNEKKVEKYLADIDKIISEKEELKNSLFVVCAPIRLIGHFKALSKNNHRIIGYVKGNYEKETLKRIAVHTDEVYKQFNKTKELEILNLIEKERNKHRVIWGAKDVFDAAEKGKGHLLVVERDYEFHAVKNDAINKTKVNLKSIKPIKHDFTSAIIESVLEHKGDIEFVENGKLDNYKGIALITRF